MLCRICNCIIVSSYSDSEDDICVDCITMECESCGDYNEMCSECRFCIGCCECEVDLY